VVAVTRQKPQGLEEGELVAYLDEVRALVLEEIERILPSGSRYDDVLYDHMRTYALRPSKCLRPALAVASCRALGGNLAGVLPTAAVLELYHNAFLIHDDVEDGSLSRRGDPTLHLEQGIPIAINVGDAMLSICLTPLLQNMRVIGMAKALRILQAVSKMTEESAEGQALELAWVREGAWDLSDRAYVRLVHKKTSWYTFLTPLVVGGIVAGAGPEATWRLKRFGTLLGPAFQIQDDVLNLVGTPDEMGKEVAGDLYEGKHTLILAHMMRSASPQERSRADALLRLARETPEEGREMRLVADEVGALVRAAQLDAATGKLLLERLRARTRAHERGAGEVEELMALIEHHGSIDYARRVADRWATEADRALGRFAATLPPSVHLDFLRGLVRYVVDRTR
jgi:geranylgeranyl diphosphate synthase type II